MRESTFEVLEPRRLYALPTVSVSDLSVREGNTGNQYAAVVVSLNARSNKTISVSYATANGSAIAGSDYSAVSGKLSFAPGETTKSILVPITGDRTPESDESFIVNLQGASNATIARATANVTIIDDEPRIDIIGGVSAPEGNSGTTPFLFTVSLSTAYDQAVTVNFATHDTTAMAGEDYAATSGTLVFAPGDTTKTITVTAFGDTTIEPTEGFVVKLSGASANASIGNSAAYGEITDDDGYYSDTWSYSDPGWYYDTGTFW